MIKNGISNNTFAFRVVTIYYNNYFNIKLLALIMVGRKFSPESKFRTRHFGIVSRRSRDPGTCPGMRLFSLLFYITLIILVKNY